MKLVKALRKQGFEVERTGSGHWKVTRPEGGQAVILAFSPSRKPQHQTIKLLQQIGYKP